MCNSSLPLRFHLSIHNSSGHRRTQSLISPCRQSSHFGTRSHTFETENCLAWDWENTSSPYWIISKYQYHRVEVDQEPCESIRRKGVRRWSFMRLGKKRPIGIFHANWGSWACSLAQYKFCAIGFAPTKVNSASRLHYILLPFQLSLLFKEDSKINCTCKTTWSGVRQWKHIIN